VSTGIDRAGRYIAELLQTRDAEVLAERLKPHPPQDLRRFPSGTQVDETILEARWKALSAAAGEAQSALLDPQTLAQAERYRHNIENFVGTVKLPVGIAGPLRVNGLFANGEFFVPLATTEAALVASYSRGALLISLAGGCTATVLDESVGRAPGFAFKSLADAGQFVAWLVTQTEMLREVAESTTRHGKLKDMRISIEGNHVYVMFEYMTGEASGQNMVTIATDAVCRHVVEASPVKPLYYYVEANFSGDKKASAQSFQLVRGKKVTAEAFFPARLIEKVLHATPRQMVDYWRMSAIGGVLSGTMGVQGHYANGIAALYIACGQDAACVSESAVGVTRMELTESGDLYTAVTLPNLMVGTVGGGTGLPSQRACLEILGLSGPDSARALAEICAALCMAGELSIIGALCAGHFTRAHQSLARGAERR